MTEVIINNFSGGSSESSREQTTNKFDFVKHFDIYSDPKRLLPAPTIISNNTGITAATNTPGNFLMYGSTIRLFARKGATTDNKPKLYVNTGADQAWEALTTAEATNAYVPNYISFIEFKGNLYGMHADRRIWSYIGTSFTDVQHDTGSSNIPYTNGIIGKANGYLFIPAANKIFQTSDGTTFTQSAITIPTDELIYGLENYGNYLSILTRGSTADRTSAKSYIYLWDFASSNATEIIELPDAGYTVLGRVGGIIIAVGEKRLTSGIEITVASYSGAIYQTLWNRVFPSTVSLVKGVGRTNGDRLYFAINDSATGRPYQGIWCVGRKNNRYPIAVSLAFDYLESGGTASDIVNFIVTTGVTFANQEAYICTADGNIHKITGTTYATTAPSSYFETVKYKAKVKGNMRAVSCSYAPLPTNGTITISYKADDDSSWTDIISDSTDNSSDCFADHIRMGTAAGQPLPQNFTEIQFKVTSLGGAAPIEFKAKWDEVPAENYG